MPKTPPRYTVDVQRQGAEQVLHHHRSVAQVAKQLRCSPQSVKNWIEKYRQSLPRPSTGPSPSSSSQSPLAFLPIRVDHHSSSAQIELITQNGLTLRFPVETHIDTLSGIIQRLEANLC